MRRAVMVLHRWVALIASVLVLIVAITGSALVFEGAMDRGLHPALWHVTPASTHVSLDTIAARVKAMRLKGAVTGITLSPADDRAYVVQAGANQVFVDPYTGRVNGTRTVAEWNRTLPRRLHVLHVQLMAGKVGGEIVAVVTIATLFLVLTGVLLWWPDKIATVRWSASWKRIVFDLHHVTGILAAVVLLIIAGSGVVMHYEPLSNVMYSFDKSPEPEMLDQSEPAPGARSISLDSLYGVATKALPGARVMFLTLPPKGDQPFVAAMRYPEDHTPGGRSRVYVDRYTGGVLLATSTRHAELGTRMGNAIRSVHTGDLYGKPTEVVWLLAALMLATQAVTGVLMWWNGRRARGAKRRVQNSNSD